MSTGTAQFDDGWIRFPPFPHPRSQPLGALIWIGRLLVGAVCVVALLAFLASIPVLNLLALGYLLEAQGQIARTGTLRFALPLLPAVNRLASMTAGTGLFLVPVWLLADAAADARLVAPSSGTAWLWTGGLVGFATVVGVHIVLALACGGRYTSFLRPIRNVRQVSARLRAGEFWATADRGLREFFAAVRLPHLIILGASGFVGAWAWLILPTAFFLARPESAGAWHGTVTLLGGAILVVLLGWVPFLQVRLAAENRWSGIFELGRVRVLFRHAPLLWLLATVLLYASSIPLFLYTAHLKLHAPWLSVWWDVTLISVVCTLPARSLLAWVYHRATRRTASSSGKGAWEGLVWTARIVLAVALGFYLWLLHHTPMTHDVAPWRLAHHALVLPVPAPNLTP